MNFRGDKGLTENFTSKHRIPNIHDLPTQKKLKTEQSPAEDTNKISCRPFQYLSTVKKTPGETVIIKGNYSLLLI